MVTSCLRGIGDSGYILVIAFDTQLSEWESVFVLVQHFAQQELLASSVAVL